MFNQENPTERTRNAVIVQMCTSPINRSDPKKDHWAKILMTNLEVNYPQQFGGVPTLRFRDVQHEGRPCYSIKQTFNRVRLTLVPYYKDGNLAEPSRVKVLTCLLSGMDTSAPFKPRYPRGSNYEHTFDFAKEYSQLVAYCIEMLSLQNEYSKSTHERILYTTDLAEVTGKVFFAGTIAQPLLQADRMWNILLENGQSVKVQSSAFGSSKPLKGYSLVYKNENEAEVIAISDLRRYYRNIMDVLPDEG